ncbi:retrovirus-related pol polyprotein from transposon [Plakobranchus ocellatus]|uniref:Retrovirus-related pol polyprotein from transposon n=1 Tax=Plakobranchus ocellatus TaxID=259542 RepID=A0AAV4C020_9GAST|nr:retrovirus-related pol polyprotein from transposon [Plakobranchus ocellatus]
MITTSPTLRHFDLSEEVTVAADTSQYGLEAALLQEGRPVCYSSCSLNKAERNYAQICQAASRPPVQQFLRVKTKARRDTNGNTKQQSATNIDKHNERRMVWEQARRFDRNQRILGCERRSHHSKCHDLQSGTDSDSISNAL